MIIILFKIDRQEIFVYSFKESAAIRAETKVQ
jgi:hypothetical protein